jgi:CheY-like chemotaxis protein
MTALISERLQEISGIGMPGEKGCTLIRESRSLNTNTAGISAIALTAYAATKIASKGSQPVSRTIWSNRLKPANCLRWSPH